MEALNGILAIILLFVMIAFYFLPVIVAVTRKHKNSLAIFMLDLFLGWTVIGWIIAIIWSTTHVIRRKLST